MAAGILGPGTGRRHGMMVPVGVLTIATFGTFALVGIWRLLTQKGPEVTVAPEFLTDIKISKKPIPWSLVTAISSYEFQGRIDGATLRIDPRLKPHLLLGPISRVLGRLSQTRGEDYVTLTPGSTGLSGKELFDLATAYWSDYQKNKGVDANV